MAFGMRIWDASGNLMLDLSRRLGRIIGFVDTGAGTSGSVADANFAGGDPWFFTMPLEALGANFNPEITVTGTLLEWEFPDPAVANNVRIFYGIR